MEFLVALAVVAFVIVPGVALLLFCDMRARVRVLEVWRPAVDQRLKALDRNVADLGRVAYAVDPLGVKPTRQVARPTDEALEAARRSGPDAYPVGLSIPFRPSPGDMTLARTAAELEAARLPEQPVDTSGDRGGVNPGDDDAPTAAEVAAAVASMAPPPAPAPPPAEPDDEPPSTKPSESGQRRSPRPSQPPSMAARWAARLTELKEEAAREEAEMRERANADADARHPEEAVANDAPPESERTRVWGGKVKALRRPTLLGGLAGAAPEMTGGTLVSTSIDPATVASIERLAFERGVSPGDMATELVQRGIEGEEDRGTPSPRMPPPSRIDPAIERRWHEKIAAAQVVRRDFVHCHGSVCDGNGGCSCSCDGCLALAKLLADAAREVKREPFVPSIASVLAVVAAGRGDETS